MNAPVITNATPLTNFALVERPDLMLAIWPGRIFTTPEVMAEYQAGVIIGRLPARAWDKLPIIQLVQEEEDIMQTMKARLGRGERSCIAAAVYRKGLLITDDLDARRFAQTLGVPISGSLGVLIAGVRSGLVDKIEGNLLLTRMIASGFRSPVKRLDDLV